MQIGGLLQVDDSPFQPLGNNHPTHAGARRKDFGEGRSVNDVVFVTDGFGVRHQWAENIVGIINFAVRVVFDNDEIITLRKLYQLFPAAFRKRYTTRVAERWNDINRFDSFIRYQRLKFVDFHSVAIGTDRFNIRLRQAKDLQRGQIRWAFDHNGITRID
ncbi:hypothetical protein D3C80_1323350 [compost metagenome]